MPEILHQKEGISAAVAFASGVCALIRSVGPLSAWPAPAFSPPAAPFLRTLRERFITLFRSTRLPCSRACLVKRQLLHACVQAQNFRGVIIMQDCLLPPGRTLGRAFGLNRRVRVQPQHGGEHDDFRAALLANCQSPGDGQAAHPQPFYAPHQFLTMRPGSSLEPTVGNEKDGTPPFLPR